MKLSYIADACGAELCGSHDPEITELAYDSRSVVPGTLFFCLRGEKSDGHGFIEAALKAGASAVCLEDTASLPEGIPALLVANSRETLAGAAAAFFDYPAARLRLVGVTGTNGKTTTVHLVDQILSAAGRRSGLLGTAGNRIGAETVPSSHTTPESLDLQRWLHKALAAGLQDVCLEVSSHALDQGRVRECWFDVVAFTNCTQDHLDYHGCMENYAAAKALLFTDYAARSAAAKGPVKAVINFDDRYGRDIALQAEAEVLGYAIERPADITAASLQREGAASIFTLKTPDWQREVRLPLIGDFNVYNALAAAAITFALGVEADIIVEALSKVTSAPGRLELVDAGQPFTVLVDYAHTPDGLEKVLSSLSARTGGRLIAVFGCGGDRDRGKRPLMGEVVARLADLAVVTSDNPRSEDPEAIIRDILPGMTTGKAERLIEPDRARAISLALEAAEAGDIVLIAGKGHEDYQIIGAERQHFDDRETAAGILRGIYGEKRSAS
ncbi:MAG: UDP-N-acetylmuramoyl-L-alanyl-D-glutamate--2,6-diaminopimelate ligase [bacterium]|nr:UDP-N-acetylmuramoyl-L-alanyl-D-glutamate--2,6-diaminopimelate ligase [bacterium]